jgi:hypothetical protein
MRRILVAFLLIISAQAQSQVDAEYNAGRYLGPINASSAYTRGYTGKGSTILIIDTGININSPEFKNKILNTIDYTRTGILDKVGHGTNVASIAAGARNGIGAEGVAYDANLLIAKVTDNTSYSFVNALKAIQWGASQNAIVANISANEVLNAAYVRNTTQIAPGVFKNTDPIYGGANYYNLIKPADWAAVLKGNNIILVVSAGNAGRAYPDNPATLATATDAAGNLVLGGRMMVVGNWNSLTNKLHVTSNAAGTICKNVVNNVCNDTYRISDFYIMAPGTVNYGANTTVNGVAAMTGTSQAAPVVSGAVAIVNQMWPNMKPENIVKLLLVTANKSFAGYNVNTHGQGLLDLEKATRPVGVVGIPVTGRTGTVSGGVLITSGSASLAKLSSVMVLDSFERDFYTTGNGLTIAQPNAEFNVQQSALPYRTHNNYTQYNGYTDVYTAKSGNNLTRAYFDSRNQHHMIETGRTWQFGDVNVQVTAGGFQESGTLLGTGINGALGYSNNSYTTFGNAEVTKHLSHNDRVYGSVGYGVTSVNFVPGMINRLSAVQSYSWNLGFEHAFEKNHTAGLMLSQPVTVARATATATVPTSIDSNGVVQYNQQTFSLTPPVNEMRLGAYYSYAARQTSVIGFAEHRQNYLGQAGVNNEVVGILINQSFK